MPLAVRHRDRQLLAACLFEVTHDVAHRFAVDHDELVGAAQHREVDVQRHALLEAAHVLGIDAEDEGAVAQARSDQCRPATASAMRAMKNTRTSGAIMDHNAPSAASRLPLTLACSLSTCALPLALNT